METRNTKQKELILSIMSEEKNMIHPNIQQLTSIIMNGDKSIGQATIYRNINKLVSEGKLNRISTNNGFIYDINTKLHGHFVCEQCGCIIDLYDDEYQKLVDEIERTYNLKINTSNHVFNGICTFCQNKK